MSDAMELLGRDGAVALDDLTIKALELRFPSKAVRDELCKAHLWLLRNPAARPCRMYRFIDNWLKKSPAVKKPPPVVIAWWATEERTINQGAALGMTARPGESMSQFRERIANRMRSAA